MAGQPQQAAAEQWKHDKQSVPIADGVVAAADVDQFTTYCTALSRSKAIPECYREEPGSIMSALILGRDLGVGDGAMLQNSFVLDGRVHPMTYILLGCCMKSPIFDASKYKVWTTGERFKDDYTWHCQGARVGGVPQEFSYSVAMAKRAGLWDKSSKSGKPLPWKVHPDDLGSKMPIARMMRKLFPDLIMGLVTSEEMIQAKAVDDIVDSFALSDADIEKQLTTAPEPEAPQPESAFFPTTPGVADKAEPEVVDVRAEPDAEPPREATTYKQIEMRYKNMSIEDRKAFREGKFQLVTEVKKWSDKDKNDLLIAMRDAEEIRNAPDQQTIEQ